MSAEIKIGEESQVDKKFVLEIQEEYFKHGPVVLTELLNRDPVLYLKVMSYIATHED